ncbi:hypothetical protein GCE9029_02779 [Grimontia celer]|uniref:Uncharacterized protein n=1 Tax=Grimontia celer TaxID=1796497 RepID=A0A128F4K7_9GAMM|nr:hypothetical protein GCE9029_02779 [Grimontia celer]
MDIQLSISSALIVNVLSLMQYYEFRLTKPVNRHIQIPKQPEDAGFSEIDWRCDRGVPLPV